MIEAVNTSVVQGSALRMPPQSRLSMPEVYAPKPTGRAFTSMHVRVDTSLDRAILEFRANETGDVVRQYPTETQLRAFARASKIEAQRDAQQRAAIESRNVENAAPEAPQPEAQQVSKPQAQPTPSPAPTPAPVASSNSIADSASASYQAAASAGASPRPSVTV